MNKILVVDDESDICAILKYNLEKAGFNVDTLESAEEALTYNMTTYDLLLLDIMMGSISGIDLAVKLRSSKDTSHIPIIFITAKDTEEDIVEGFNVGADDYISKPFSVNEVISRVKAVLRRSLEPKSINGKVLKFRDLELDTVSKKVRLCGKMVPMTKTEYEILSILIASPGTVWTREEILSKVWKDNVIVLDRTVDVNITRLRHKLGDYGQYVVTRHGYGYVFEINK